MWITSSIRSGAPALPPCWRPAAWPAFTAPLQALRETGWKGAGVRKEEEGEQVKGRRCCWRTEGWGLGEADQIGALEISHVGALWRPNGWGRNLRAALILAGWGNLCHPSPHTAPPGFCLLQFFCHQPLTGTTRLFFYLLFSFPQRCVMLMALERPPFIHFVAERNSETHPLKLLNSMHV